MNLLPSMRLWISLALMTECFVALARGEVAPFGLERRIPWTA